MSQKKPRQKDAAPYAQNKKAFDDVIIHFRRMDRPMMGAFGAVNPERSGSATAANPLKPMPLDFWCDVLLAVRAVLPKGVLLSNFFLAYLLFDSEDELERNVHAGKSLGGRVHSVEQRIGTEFVRRGIWPLSVYLNPPRLGRPKHKI